MSDLYYWEKLTFSKLFRTEKQIMPFKITVNWLFNDICYLVILSGVGQEKNQKINKHPPVYQAPKSIVFSVYKQTLRLNNLKTRTATNAKISEILICVEVIIYLLLDKSFWRKWRMVTFRFLSRLKKSRTNICWFHTR